MTVSVNDYRQKDGKKQAPLTPGNVSPPLLECPKEIVLALDAITKFIKSFTDEKLRYNFVVSEAEKLFKSSETFFATSKPE